MALFFDINNLEKEAEGDPNKFLALLDYHHSAKIPKNKFVKYKPSKLSLKGSSYILNPGPIFESNLDPSYLVQYIKLAGRRNYFFYKTHGQIHLDTTFYPELNLEKIKSNPLLTITNNQIKFKFEEIKNGSKIR